MQKGTKILAKLCEHFKEVEVFEQCSEYFKMRINRDEQTIGHIFGFIQSKKQEMGISEYSVSETSLEQIF